MRLIDADALKYEPLPKGDRNYRTYNIDDAYDDGYDDAFVDINNAPTIDAVPVVRCKDCKWWKTIHPRYWVTYKVCVREAYEPFRQAEDFCSYGERREDVDE